MKKFITYMILAFARLLTRNLSPSRKNNVYSHVKSGLSTDLIVEMPSGTKIVFYDNTNLIVNFIQNLQNDETDTISWIEAMPKDGVLWDIGANIGFFSLYAGSLLGRDGVRVVGFEPGAASYAVLNRNIEGNAMGSHIVAYCVALAGATKVGRLNMGAIGAGVAAGGWCNGFESEIDGLDRDINPVFQQGSVGFSMDDFVQMFQPPLPTHIKIDVDGIEAEILRGGKRTLSGKSVRSMSVEMEGDLNSERSREVFGLMDELGFVPRPRQSPELRNVIFERPAAD